MDTLSLTEQYVREVVRRLPADLGDLPGYRPPPDQLYLSFSRVAVTRAYEL